MRRFGRATGARTRSAVSDCIVRTVSFGKRSYYDQRVVAKFKADSEVTFLHEQSRIGESAFEQVYGNRFRLIMQGGELYRLQNNSQ